MTHIPTGADPTDPNAAGHEVGGGHGGTGDVPELTAARPLRSDVWRQFRKNRLAVIGLVFILFLALVAIFADVIAPHGFAERPGSETGAFRQPPSSEFWFGTDSIGRDLFSRLRRARLVAHRRPLDLDRALHRTGDGSPGSSAASSRR